MVRNLWLPEPVLSRSLTCATPSVTWVFLSPRRAACSVTTSQLLTAPPRSMPSFTRDTPLCLSTVSVKPLHLDLLASTSSGEAPTQLTSSASTGVTATSGCSSALCCSGEETQPTSKPRESHTHILCLGIHVACLGKREKRNVLGLAWKDGEQQLYIQVGLCLHLHAKACSELSNLVRALLRANGHNSVNFGPFSVRFGQLVSQTDPWSFQSNNNSGRAAPQPN